MNKWLHQFRFEMGMIFRNPWLLMMPLFLGIWMFYLIQDGFSSEMFVQRTHSSIAITHTMSLGLVMLLGILSIRRDIRRRSYEWSDALPVSNTTKVTAKYTVALLYCTLFTLVSSAILTYLSAQTGVDASVTVDYIKYYATTYEISYAVTLALAMLLAISIPNRVVYLIGFCGWMFGTFFMEIFLIERLYLYPLRTFHLSQLFISGQMNSEIWGMALVNEEIIFSRLFVISFTLLMIVVGIAILNNLRRTKYVSILWGSVILALLLAGGSFVPYESMWQQRYAQNDQKLKDPTVKTIDEDTSYQRPEFTISHYDISINRGGEDYLEAKAVMNVQIPAYEGIKELPFTLNRTFTVSKVKLNGVETSFDHQGDKLTIIYEDKFSEAVQVEVEYAGTMMDYILRSSGNGDFAAFVKGPNVFLPQYIAWYPLAGYQSVYVKEINASYVRVAPIYYATAKRSPAYFQLILTGFESPIYTSIPEKERSEGRQVFEGSVRDKVTLIGGTMQEVQHPDLPVNLVTSPYSVSAANDILDRWNQMYHYFGSWMPDFKPKINQLIYVAINNYMPFAPENKTYFSTQGYWDNDYLSKILMNSMMVGSREEEHVIENTRDDVRLQIRALIWYLYYREVEGFTDEDLANGWGNHMLMELYATDETRDPDRLGLRMVSQVSKVIDEGQSRELKELLNFFYNQGLEIVEYTNEGTLSSKQRVSYAQWEQEWKRVIICD